MMVVNLVVMMKIWAVMVMSHRLNGMDMCIEKRVCVEMKVLVWKITLQSKSDQHFEYDI